MPYEMPTIILFGDGCLTALPDILAPYRKIAFFHGRASYAPNAARLDSLLQGKDILHIADIAPEPEVRHLEECTEQLQSFGPDCVLALGGGSVLDIAKGAAFCAPQAASVLDLLRSSGGDFADSLPVIAIPTTAGTGSEVTPFAVFWNHGEKKKYSFGYRQLYPAHALVDPQLTYSMPPKVTACTGMDAFTQACESYWNNNHNPTSDAYALEAVSLILPALPRAVADGADVSARHDVAFGSLTAGKAFSNTRTAACHSISYPMTLYFGVTHGQAVGITLPEVLLLDAQVMPARVQPFCEALGVSSMKEAAEKIRHMMQVCGLCTRLSELGIDRAGIDTIVEHGFTPERMGNNPYAFTKESLRTMLLGIL
jgi:alcohol dehydrogenase